MKICSSPGMTLVKVSRCHGSKAESMEDKWEEAGGQKVMQYSRNSVRGFDGGASGKIERVKIRKGGRRR